MVLISERFWMLRNQTQDFFFFFPRREESKRIFGVRKENEEGPKFIRVCNKQTKKNERKKELMRWNFEKIIN